MDLVLLVYLVETVLGALGTVVGIMTLLLVLSAVIGFVSYIIIRDDKYLTEEEIITFNGKYIKAFKVWLSGVFIAFLLLLVPNQETGYKMVAAYGAQELIQLEETKQVGSKAYQAINKILDDFIGEELSDDIN